jgi:hypothetical protein
MTEQERDRLLDALEAKYTEWWNIRWNPNSEKSDLDDIRIAGRMGGILDAMDVVLEFYKKEQINEVV